MRPRFSWNIGRRSLPLGERTLIMGVLNVTPDSFSDGGRYFSPSHAIAHGLALLDEGADILDIGGESTRPGAPTATASASITTIPTTAATNPTTANSIAGESSAAQARADSTPATPLSRADSTPAAAQPHAGSTPTPAQSHADSTLTPAQSHADSTPTPAQSHAVPTANPHSTAARAAAVSAEEELSRVLPVIEAIKRLRPDAVLSIDTYKSAVAARALRAGAEIVNDVSGLLWDPAMAATLAAHPCGVILMHVRGLPHQWRTQPPVPDIVSLVLTDLRARARHALDAGIPSSALVLDPGFGFGKNFDENYPLLARFAELQTLGFPLLAAASRKSFLGHTLAARLATALPSELPIEPPSPLSSATLPAPSSALSALLPPTAVPSTPAPPTAGPPTPAPRTAVPAIPVPPTAVPPTAAPPTARDNATLAASVAAVLAGAHIVRVHSVRPALEALAIADAILRA